MSRRSGFSLVELLVAMAVFGLLLGVLASVFASAGRGYRTTAAVSDLQQRAQVAAALLRYEVGLAGYRGASAAYTSVELGGVPLTLELGGVGASDAITTRYFEDRYAGGGGSVREVTYAVGGSDALLRTFDGATTPALLGVTSLKVLRLVAEDGRPIAVGVDADPAGAVAIVVEVALGAGYATEIAIGFHNVDLSDPAQVQIRSAQASVP